MPRHGFRDIGMGEDMDVTPQISVIVPIYNVEKYIRKCLDSLKNQTMKEIEVICIDDGSTDNSGRIADEYKTDSRFRVIHTENRGLSAARNRGIDEAEADWIMFVDSDDWVEPGFCERPYKTAIEKDAELVIFQAERLGKKKKSPVGILDLETAIKYGDSFAWNKLYKQSLFTDIRYPEGRVYEDLAITHKLERKVGRIVLLPDVLYHQTFRKDSITQCISAENKRDGFQSAIERANDLKEYGCSEETYESTLVSYAIGLLTRSFPSDDPVYALAANVADTIAYIPTELTWQKRIMLRIWKVNKALFHFICNAAGQKDRNSLPCNYEKN